MIYRWTTRLVLIFSAILSGCAYIEDYQSTSQIAVDQSINIITEQRLTPFNRLWVDAPIDIQIVSSLHPAYSLKAIGKGMTLSNLNIRVKNHTLIIQSPATALQATGRTLLKIQMGTLNNLHYYGLGTAEGHIISNHLVVDVGSYGNLALDGNKINLRRLTANTSGDVIIHGVKTHNLDVIANGPRNIILNGSGEMRLQHLIYNGSGNVRIAWVDGDQVVVKSTGHGKIFLAGVANLLNVELAESASVDAKYLRARKGFINTAQNAQAEVYVTRSLNAFATGSSNIYHYTMPLLLGKYMRDRGSVLMMSTKVPVCRIPECVRMPSEPG